MKNVVLAVNGDIIKIFEGPSILKVICLVGQMSVSHLS